MGLFDDDTADDAAPPAFSGPSLFGDEPEAPAKAVAYRVLARKYRPTTFNDLIGQEALVRTLRNAFAMNRIAHAFMLTGVRGVGKTTTARILARALNCTGPDGSGGPTPDPCGLCENCIAILADRHPDVVEMDAASNTGVDDVREIIEATRFKPLSARTKVFIIDEVHMLSKQAFNALLKTLEEPPPHIKFVLATTEIRKVPITVLSRCQRFDLRRVAVSELSAHFTRIAQNESVAISPGAIEHIARAADGSVRDGLSLLDQAIARGSEDETGITAEMVAEMLGLADRSYVFELMDALVAGDAAKALEIADGAYARGADLGVLLADLLGLTHLLTRMKSVPALMASTTLPEAERTRGAALAGVLSIPFLGRLWQMLLKGVQEVEAAPDRRAAAEMILIRLCHVADMPPPGELLKRITESGATAQGGAGPGPSGGGSRAVANGAPAMMQAAPRAITFLDVVALAEARRDVALFAHLRQSVHLVRFAPPVIELRLEPQAPRDLVGKLAALLEAETHRRWTVALSNAPGEPTIDQAEGKAESEVMQFAVAHPLVLAILAEFPGAKIEKLHPGEAAAEPEMPADWAALAPPDEFYEGDDE
ncbi:DNA polymerase III subunit gamma/tau [Acidocella sp.]|uniref:DNA polymerase III subunit gamma/tau n=1 Tax=Acidocella sp. TaxID=50710 RepID=UPI002623202F|nr:DNA polymerase III subunit gamma/tau [Acidocella sp.]MDD2796121.1 DNA polymerase III subunit gamma/tau [Acidocella sp.]